MYSKGWITLLTLLAIVIVMACSKESSPVATEDVNNFELEVRAEKVAVCHIDNQGRSKIKLVNINTLDKHIEHGDAVDMDGDGYFDKANACGGIDCDDNDPTRTVTCCESFCLYCDPIPQGLFNFGDCIVEPPTGGDYYCKQTFITTVDCGEEIIVDAMINDIDDWDYPTDCDDDNQRHLASFTARVTNLCGVYTSYAAYFYFSPEPFEFVFEEHEEVVSEEVAFSCVEALDALALDNGLVNICDAPSLKRKELSDIAMERISKLPEGMKQQISAAFRITSE